MSESFLSRLEIRFVHHIASLEPGDMFGLRNCHGSGAVFTSPCGVAVIVACSLPRLRRTGRRRHANDIGESVILSIFLVVAMTTAFAVMLLPALCGRSGAK